MSFRNLIEQKRRKLQHKNALMEGVNAEISRIQRRLVLKFGPISASTSHPVTSWRTPPMKMKFIVSSTFTDTAREREVFMGEALHILRPLAAVHGIEIIVVDMRWGVRDENTLDHRTWIECSRIIEMCRDESCGTFFVSLQSEKYGYTPLPKSLDKQLLDERLAMEHVTEDDIALAKEWYILDDNALPSMYVLRNLDSINDDFYWKKVAPTLLNVLDGLPFDENLCKGLLVNRSVSEYEVKSALSRENGDAARIFWFNREFHGGVTKHADPKGKYLDYLEDPIKQQRYMELKQWMLDNIPAEQRKLYNSATFEAYVSENNDWKDQFNRWKEDVLIYLKLSLEDIVQMHQSWKGSACGLDLNISGEEVTEMVHHAKWAADKLQDFVGRERLVNDLLGHIFTESSSLSTPQINTSPLSGITVAVIGVSGAGKTALMAHVAGQVYERQRHSDIDELHNRPIISRYCGTSAMSYTGLNLVRSICRQIHFALGHDLSQSKLVLSLGYNEVVQHLSQLLKDYPVVLFVDSLDQLSDDDLARSKISFLRDITPHKYTRIIVSALPDERDTVTGKWKYIYGCDSRLSEASVSRVIVPKVDTANESDGSFNEARTILTHLMKLKRRTLTPNQWEYCMLQSSHEPTALYLSLAVRVISTWASTDPLQDLLLSNSVTGLINQIFDKIERAYGEILTRAALGFITFSVGGVTDTEMCDLLTLDSEVLSHVCQYSKINFIPSHVWLRLRAELYGLITEKGGSCLGWYHRQLKEVTELRYSATEKKKLSAIMARYFSNLIPKETLMNTNVNSQPLLLGTENSRELFLPHCNYLVNARRCLEAGEHLLNAGLLEEARDELCEPLGVLARLKCGDCFSLVQQLSRLAILLPQDVRVDHYLRWVRRDSTQLATFPGSMIASCMSQPKISVARQDLIAVIDDLYTACSFYQDTVVRCVTLGVETDFDPLESILQGHSDAVSCLCFSHDGLFIASSSGDHTVRVWDSRSGAILNELQGHLDYVYSVSFSPDGSQIASGAGDSTIRISETLTGVLLMEFLGHTNSVNCVCYNPFGETIVSASSDNTVRIWDLVKDSGQVIGTLQHKGAVSTVAYSNDGTKIVSGTTDGTVYVWDVSKLELLHELFGHLNAVRSVSFNPSSDRIVSGSWDKTIRVWDAVSGQSLKTIDGHSDSVYTVAYSPDGTKLVSGSGSGDRTIKFWDAESGIMLRELLGHTNYVTCVRFSPDGKKIISSSGDRTIRIWDANTEGEMSERQGHRKYVTSVCYLSDSDMVVSGSGDGNLCIWSRTTGDVLHTLKGHSKFIYAVSASPDGALIASGGGDCSIRLWDNGGNFLKEILGHTDYIYSINFSPDGTTIVSGSVDRSIRLWDSRTGILVREIPTAHSGAVYCVCFSPDGTKLASASSDRTSCVWDVATGTNVKVFRGHSAAVYSTCFSGDGIRVASGSGDRTICIWNATLSIPFMRLCGHTVSVRSVCFSTDGQRIVSGSFDRTVRVWDAQTGETLNELLGHAKYVSSVSFRRDGMEIVSGSGDRSVRLWNSLRGPPRTPRDEVVKESHTRRISAIASATPISTATTSAFKFSVGEKVEAQFENGDEFFAAYVVGVADDGSYSVLYDDGDKEDNLLSHRVRRPG